MGERRKGRKEKDVRGRRVGVVVEMTENGDGVFKELNELK